MTELSEIATAIANARQYVVYWHQASTTPNSPAHQHLKAALDGLAWSLQELCERAVQREPIERAQAAEATMKPASSAPKRCYYCGRSAGYCVCDWTAKP